MSGYQIIIVVLSFVYTGKRSRSRSASKREQSLRRSPSHYSSGYSPHRERSASRYSSRSSVAQSILSHSSIRRSRSRVGNHDSRRTEVTEVTKVPAVEPTDNRAQGALPLEIPTDAPQEIPEHEINLQQEIVNVIGARLETDKKTAEAVHKDVAFRWSEIIKKGLPSEEVKSLLEKYPTPINCDFISVPKLNAESTAAVQESAVKRDKRIVEKQERVTACLGAVGKAISILLKADIPEKIELLEKLSDRGRLLASIHRDESLARKSIIMANLNISMKTTLSNTTVDEWLFGGDLEEKIKIAKNLEKTTKVLKPPQKDSQQNNIQRNTKNVRGPPRQQLYRNRIATSGGQRKISLSNHRRTSSNSEARRTSHRREPTRDRYRRRH